MKILREKYNLKFINIKELMSLSDYPVDDEEVQQCILLIKKIETAINEKKNQNNNNINNVLKDEKEKNREKANKNKKSDGDTITKVIPSIKMNID